MLRIRITYWPVMMLLILVACRKDVEDFKPYAPSAEALGSLLATQVPDASRYTSFTFSNLATDKTLETASGARIFLVDTDALFEDASTGQPVLCSTCSDLKIEITEVLDKRDIIARGLHTVGDSGTLFESGGMVNVTVSCNGEKLALSPSRTLKIQLPNNNTQSGLFVFAQGASTSEQWSNSNQEVYEAEWPVAGGNTQTGYELLVKKLGWSASGRSITDPTTSYCIELPPGFADQNTLAYIVFKNQQVVAPLQFDLGDNSFCFPKAPTSYQVQLMAVSKLGEQYWLGKAQTEIGSTSATYPLGPQQLTEDAVVNFVKGL